MPLNSDAPGTVTRIEKVELNPRESKLKELGRFRKTSYITGLTLIYQVLILVVLPLVLSALVVWLIPAFNAEKMAQTMTDPKKSQSFFVIMLAFQALLTFGGNIFALLPVKQNYKLGIKQMMFPSKVPNTTYMNAKKILVAFVMAIGIGTAGSFVGVTLQRIIPKGETSKFALSDLGAAGGAAGIFITSILISLIAPITEELIFRGAILMPLRRYGDKFAIIVSSLLFGIVHGNLEQIPFAFSIGLVLGYITVKSNSVIPAIIIHFLNNFKSNLAMILMLKDGVDIENIDPNLKFSEMAFSLKFQSVIGMLSILCLVYAVIRLALHKKWLRFDNEFKIPNELIPAKKKHNLLYDSNGFNKSYNISDYIFKTVFCKIVF